MLDKTTNKIVLKNSSSKFKSTKCFGKIIVQYNICKTGNKKLMKNTAAQNKKAKNDLYFLRAITDFDLKPPFDEV